MVLCSPLVHIYFGWSRSSFCLILIFFGLLSNNNSIWRSDCFFYWWFRDCDHVTLCSSIGIIIFYWLFIYCCWMLNKTTTYCDCIVSQQQHRIASHHISFIVCWYCARLWKRSLFLLGSFPPHILIPNVIWYELMNRINSDGWGNGYYWTIFFLLELSVILCDDDYYHWLRQ